MMSAAQVVYAPASARFIMRFIARFILRASAAVSSQQQMAPRSAMPLGEIFLAIFWSFLSRFFFSRWSLIHLAKAVPFARPSGDILGHLSVGPSIDQSEDFSFEAR